MSSWTGKTQQIVGCDTPVWIIFFFKLIHYFYFGTAHCLFRKNMNVFFAILNPCSLHRLSTLILMVECVSMRRCVGVLISCVYSFHVISHFFFLRSPYNNAGRFGASISNVHFKREKITSNNLLSFTYSWGNRCIFPNFTIPNDQFS